MVKKRSNDNLINLLNELNKSFKKIDDNDLINKCFFLAKLNMWMMFFIYKQLYKLTDNETDSLLFSN